MNKLAWSASLLLSAALVAVPAAGAAPRMAYPGEPRTIEKTFPAESLQRISVKANVGKIEVTGGTQNQVTLHLELMPKRIHNGWLGRSEEGDPNDAELVAETRGDELHLDLDVKGDRDGLEENWTLTVPARLSARLQVNVGDLDVRDLSGGLELKDNVGNITAEVPEGDVDARVNVGDIRVTSATPSYGDVSLKSNVGDVHIEMKDHSVDYPKPAGSGNHISLRGPGKDRISLKTNVGDARLILRSTV